MTTQELDEIWYLDLDFMALKNAKILEISNFFSEI